MAKLLAFYDDKLYGEYTYWPHWVQVPDGTYLLDGQCWFRKDKSRVLLSDVPKGIRALALILRCSNG